MVRLGARAFALAWAIHALAEFAFGILGPGLLARFESGSYGLNPWVGVAVLVFWPLFGAGLGASVGLTAAGPLARARQRGHDPARLLASLGSLSVVAALAINLQWGESLGRSGVVAIAALVALIAVSWFKRTGFLAGVGHPWIIIPTLLVWLCAVRIVWLQASLGLRIGATLGVLGLAILAARVLGERLARAPLASGRLLLGALGLSALALFALNHVPPPGLPTAAGDDPSATPVIMIVLDTVRADHLSTYGYQRNTDPNLARFAKQATVYEHALASGDMTLTSHASLFTGRWVANHGAVPGAPKLGDEHETLAELLGDAGYATAGIAANCGWIASGKGIEQGFDYWDTRCAVSPFRGIGPPYLRSRLVGQLRRHFFPAHAMWEWRNAQTITDESLRVLDHLAKDDAPFFLFLNYMDVHRPIHPPERYRTRFPGRIPGFDMMHDWSAMNRGAASGERRVESDEREHLISQYDGALAFLDDQLARVFAELERRGLLDRSLIWIVSDHGESFGAHGTFGHGFSVYQGVVGIPFIVKLPGQQKGQRSATPVGLADVVPSIAALLELPVPAGLDGRALYSANLDPERPVVSESYSVKGRQMRALLQGTHKVVERPGEVAELYDLASDPAETVDLATRQPEMTAALTAAFESALAGAAAGKEHALDAADIERLEALGYLERE